MAERCEFSEPAHAEDWWRGALPKCEHVFGEPAQDAEGWTVTCLLCWGVRQGSRNELYADLAFGQETVTYG